MKEAITEDGNIFCFSFSYKIVYIDHDVDLKPCQKPKTEIHTKIIITFSVSYFSKDIFFYDLMLNAHGLKPETVEYKYNNGFSMATSQHYFLRVTMRTRRRMIIVRKLQTYLVIRHIVFSISLLFLFEFAQIGMALSKYVSHYERHHQCFLVNNKNVMLKYRQYN